jgi:hypothetical protein
MDRKVPSIFSYRVNVSEAEEFGVFGYYADQLYDIVNVTGRPIDIYLGVSPTETHHVCLDAGERHHLGLDMHTCIRQRFRPYVQTKETICLDAWWKFYGSD